MSLGSSLSDARRRSGLSQEAVAEKLGVSRQTISKWETDETLPDIRQAKRLSVAYGVTLDELIAYEADVEEVKEAVRNTSDEVVEKIDWTKLWAEKYPVLASYQGEVAVDEYAAELRKLLGRLKRDYGYNDEDALLVLKDILGHCWKS